MSAARCTRCAPTSSSSGAAARRGLRLPLPGSPLPAALDGLRRRLSEGRPLTDYLVPRSSRTASRTRVRRARDHARAAARVRACSSGSARRRCRGATYLGGDARSTFLVFVLAGDVDHGARPPALRLAPAVASGRRSSLGPCSASSASPGWASARRRCIRSAEGASAVVNVIILPMAFLSGGFGPTRDFPEFLQAIADVLPLTYLVDIVRASSTTGSRSGSSPARSPCCRRGAWRERSLRCEVLLLGAAGKLGPGARTGTPGRVDEPSMVFVERATARSASTSASSRGPRGDAPPRSRTSHASCTLA